MIYTPEDYADGVWTHSTRTVDGLVPAPSDGSYIDDVAYAVWTYATRTASGGVATFQINVSETLDAPSQAATAQTVMPVTVAETVPAPEQAGTLLFIGKFEVLVHQDVPAPSQAGIIDTGTVKPKGAGGPRGAWDYRPPIYTIRTKGSQSVPAPSQSAFARFEPFKKVKPVRVVVKKPSVRCVGGQLILAPAQVGQAKSHRSVKAMQKEEQDILALLASL
jgi:hypothetical protein